MYPKRFKWDMPGPAPAETRTATTKADVVSGDELSKDYDEETHELLFGEPVEVTATCAEAKDTKKLDVLAPTIEWQYKNESGQYVPWHGEVWGLYSAAYRSNKMPLQAVLTFGGRPVVGHPVSWALDAVYDKSGTQVAPGDQEYPTYGRMSGAIKQWDKSSWVE